MADQLNTGKWEKGKKVNWLLSERYLGEGDNHRNKKCVSKESWETILESCEMEELL